MADAIELYLNIGTPQGALVKGLTDASAFSLGPFYQGQLLQLRVFPVIPTGVVVANPGTALFTKVPLTTLDLQVAVGPAAGTEAIKAAQYTWAKQTGVDAEGKSGYFYANLDLNTTDLNTVLGTLTSYATQIAFLLARGANPFATVFQTDITVLAVVKDPAGAAAAPTPAAAYYTSAQIDNLFVKWRNDLAGANAGRNILLLSPDGTRTREIGVDNNAAPIDNAA